MIQLKSVQLSAALLVLLQFSVVNVSAATLKQVQDTGAAKVAEGQASQKKIDKLVEGAQERLIRYRSLLKQIDGLKTYNEQLSAQVESQNTLITRFDDSISRVALIERQMMPLVTRMATSLEDFIELDLPFDLTERRERMANISDNLDAADGDVAERFRQIIEAYQIENEYGRKTDSYQDIITIEGEPSEVDVLRIGRIALLAQSRDASRTVRWDRNTSSWLLLDPASYRNPVRYAIRMANKQAPIQMLTLPIEAPEAAQ